MEKSIKKFLQFNGKNVYFLSANGVWYIAIKPICEALGVDYIRQFKNLKEDKILGQLLSEQTMVAADGRLRKMVCLPEFFIYGWIFTIKSDSEGLQDFQWKCYELLFNYFHGASTERSELLKVKTLAEIEKDKLKAELMETPAYIKLQALEEKEKDAKKALSKLDRDIVTNQIELWQSIQN